MKKKIASIMFALMVVFTLSACTELNNEVSGYYVSVDINPSVEFIVDEDDIVESYIFLNEDAEILCADLDFTGMNVDDAVELFIQTATEAGYIDPEGEDNAILITVIGEEDEEERVKEIKERIRTRAIKHLAQRYINGVVITEEFTREDLVLEAETLGVSPGKLQLSYAVLAVDDTYSKEELLDMPVKDLMNIVKEFHKTEFNNYSQERLEQMRQKKQDIVMEHKSIIEEYIASHPEMTDEEIEQYIEEYKNNIKEESRERWQERKDNWRENREDKNNQQEDTDESQSS